MSNFFDWLYTDTSKTQTPAEAQANTTRLQDQLRAQTDARVAAGTIDASTAVTNYRLANQGPLEDPGSAAADSFFKNLTFQTDPNDPNPTPGIGSVIRDVFILGAIGGGLYAFFKFGGTGLLKTLAKKNKWIVVGIAGAAALLAWLIYSQFKKTANDTASTAQGLSDSIKTFNPFA